MLKFFFFNVLILPFILQTITADKESKLVFVQILFRHGDRSPINLYPSDPNPESVWSEGLGKLTMLGRKQHYALGKYFRQLYENFTTSSPNEVAAMSSDVDRCMKSAETNLASFFAPSSEWAFEKDLKWQPISIFSTPKENDKLLETDSYCPRASAEEMNVINSPESRALLAKHKKMFENLTANSGSPITDWKSASYLHDALFIEKKYNLTTPSWAKPFWDELENVAHQSFYWSFNSPLLHRLRAGPLLKNIIEMMESKLAGDIPLQKVQIYSGHDTNIAAVLGALNLFNMKQPPYCATLLFELHKMVSGENAVRLLYLNSTTPEKGAQSFNVLTLKGCTEFCPLSYFISFTKTLLPNDWEKECQLDKSFIEQLKTKNITIGVFFGVIAVIIIAMSVYSTYRLHSRDRDKYSYHLMPLN